MFKHVVMWQLQDEAGGALKSENLHRMKDLLEGLPHKIDFIEVYEVGLNLSDSSAAYDIVLISGFEDEASFQEYRAHPEHQKVVEFIRSVQEKVHVVDYFIEE